MRAFPARSYPNQATNVPFVRFLTWGSIDIRTIVTFTSAIQTKHTIMKQPRLLTLQNIFDTLSKDNTLPAKSFFKEGLGVVINMNRFLQPFIHDTPSPYLIEDYRIGYIKQGCLHGIINLQEYTITAGHIAFITPGTIAEPIDISNDFLIEGIGVHTDIFNIAHSGKLPELFNGKQRNGILAVTEEEGTLLDHLFRMLYEIVSTQGDAVTYPMITALTAYVNSLFARHQKVTPPSNTAFDTFDRFIRLVNEHHEEQHRVAFYADKICLTERYLSTIVRQTGGITAKEWIDKALVTKAKVMLRHSDKQIAEIAEALHFPNPSFFCKYFKRLTGQTPQEYRKSIP